jgi:dedicator of cytokinesis protein 3
LGLYNRSAHIATRAELVPRFEATFEHELAALFPGQANVMDLPPEEPEIRRTPPPLSRNATEGASVIDTNGTEEAHAPESGLARGRRRSLNFLKRGSISSLRGAIAKDKQANGGGENEPFKRGHSRTESRARSISRGAVELFGRRPSAAPAADGAAIRKRLSFLQIIDGDG